MPENETMMTRALALPASALFAALLMSATSARALTMKECSAKYKEAQTANPLNGMKWNDFRKAECGSDASATPAAAPAGDAKPTMAPAAAPKTAAKPAAAPAAAPAAPSNAVFPSAVAPKYSKETEGKARMHTCLA